MNSRIELTEQLDILHLVAYKGGRKYILSLDTDEPRLYLPEMYLDKMGRVALVDILNCVTRTASFTALRKEDHEPTN